MYYYYYYYEFKQQFDMIQSLMILNKKRKN